MNSEIRIPFFDLLTILFVICILSAFGGMVIGGSMRAGSINSVYKSGQASCKVCEVVQNGN